MEIWQAIVLGAVQGFAEFLPVSSSGHLILMQRWLGVTEGGLFFESTRHPTQQGRDIQMLGTDTDTTSAIHTIIRSTRGSMRLVPPADLRGCTENPGIIQQPEETGDRQFQRTLGKAIAARGTFDQRIPVQKRPEPSES